MGKTGNIECGDEMIFYDAVLPVKICGKACLTSLVSCIMVSFRKGNGNIWEPMSRFGSRYAISENPFSYCSSCTHAGMFMFRTHTREWVSQ